MRDPQLPYAHSLSLRHPDSAIILLKKIHLRAVEKDDQVSAGLCLQQMGQICFNQGHYAQALEFYLHADKIFTSVGNAGLLAANMSQMGILYYYNKQLNKSRVLYNRALTIYKRDGNMKGQAEVFGDIGHLYEKHKRYDSAFYYQNLALSYYKRVKSKSGAAKIYENLGSIYEDLAQYDSAYVFFNRSLSLYRADHNVVSSIEVINNLGDILRKTGRYRESIIESKAALGLSVQTNNLYQQASACRDLGKAWQLLHVMDSAYHYLEMSRAALLAVYSREAANQTAFLQVLYDMNKKSDEISRLNNIRKTNRIIFTAVACVAVLVVVLALVIFSRQRLKIRNQKVLAQQKESIFEARHELMELELKNRQLEEESLKQQLELKSRALSAHTLNQIKNNQLLEELRISLQEMVKDDKRDQKKQMQQLIRRISESFSHEQYWKEFSRAFEQVHQRFYDRLKEHSRELTAADIRLLTLLKINLDSRDISALLGISTDSLRVSRHRLRRKLNIPQGSNLTAFIQAL